MADYGRLWRNMAEFGRKLAGGARGRRHVAGPVGESEFCRICLLSNTLPHPEGWATDPSRFAIAAARRSSKEIASVSRDCWSRGVVYMLCFGYRFRLRDDEKRSNEPAQFCMFFGAFCCNFGLFGWSRGLLRPRRGLKRASGGLRGGPGGDQGGQKSSIGRS